MVGTWYSDATHFMNESGELADMPGPATSIAVFLRSVVGWVTMRHALNAEETNVTCRRSPGQRRYAGEIGAYLLPDTGQIIYMCPECGDNGVITGWEGTSWDRSAHSLPPDGTVVH
jgi:hypothetical protein